METSHLAQRLYHRSKRVWPQDFVIASIVRADHYILGQSPGLEVINKTGT